MGLSLGQRRVLTKTEKAIRVSDPRLASLMDMFGWLNRAEEIHHRTPGRPGTAKAEVGAAQQGGQPRL